MQICTKVLSQGLPDDQAVFASCNEMKIHIINKKQIYKYLTNKYSHRGYLTIKQYSPRRFTVLHWVSFLISSIGEYLNLIY